MNKFLKVLLIIVAVVITLGVVGQAAMFGYLAINPETRENFMPPISQSYHDVDGDGESDGGFEYDRRNIAEYHKFSPFSRFGMHVGTFGFHRPGGLLPFLVILAGGFFLGRYVQKKGVRLKVEKNGQDTSVSGGES